MKKRIDTAVKSKKSTRSLSTRLRQSFDVFIQTPSYGHSDKIFKRYIGLFATLKDDHALAFCLKALINDPGLRDTIYRYLLELGHSDRVRKALIAYLAGDHALDDASLCQIARVMTLWKIKPGTVPFRSLAKLGMDISNTKYTSKSYYYLLASIWLVSKFGTRKQLKILLQNTEDLWSNSEFLSRQVAASAARFHTTAAFKWISIKIERHGFRSAVSVLNSLRELQSYTTSVPGPIRLYMLNGQNVGKYSIQRFLVSYRVLTSPTLAKPYLYSLRDKLIKYVSDPHYEAILKAL